MLGGEATVTVGLLGDDCHACVKTAFRRRAAATCSALEATEAQQGEAGLDPGGTPVLMLQIDSFVSTVIPQMFICRQKDLMLVFISSASSSLGRSPLPGSTSKEIKWSWVWAREPGWHQEAREEAVCWNLVRKKVVTPQQYHFTFLKNLAYLIRECTWLSDASL